MAKTYKVENGLDVEVRKDFYLGLWNIYYVDGGKWAGPFKTKKEAVQKLLEQVS